MCPPFSFYHPVSTYSAVQQQFFCCGSHSCSVHVHMFTQRPQHARINYLYLGFFMTEDRKFGHKSGSSILFLACLRRTKKLVLPPAFVQEGCNIGSCTLHLQLFPNHCNSNGLTCKEWYQIVNPALKSCAMH